MLAITVGFEVTLDEPGTKDLNNEKWGGWYNHKASSLKGVGVFTRWWERNNG